METPDCGAIEENSTIFVEIKDFECCAFQIWHMLSTQVVACSNIVVVLLWNMKGKIITECANKEVYFASGCKHGTTQVIVQKKLSFCGAFWLKQLHLHSCQEHTLSSPADHALFTPNLGGGGGGSIISPNKTSSCLFWKITELPFKLGPSVRIRATFSLNFLVLQALRCERNLGCGGLGMR